MSAHPSAQSVSSLHGRAENGIRRIVAHRHSESALTFPGSEPEAEPFLLKAKSQLEENNASRLRLFGATPETFFITIV
jgi:hypothetical protein